RVISKQLEFDADRPVIEVSLFGEHIDDELIENCRRQLSNYKLENAELEVFQGYRDNSHEATLTSTLRTGIVEELYKQNEQVMRSKDERIDFLEREVIRLKGAENQSQEIGQEIKALYPGLEAFTLNRTLYLRLDPMKQDTTYLALAEFKKPLSKADTRKLEEWLKARVKTDKVMVVVR